MEAQEAIRGEQSKGPVAHQDATLGGQGELAAEGHDGVLLTGGEPTLHPALPELVRIALGAGLALGQGSSFRLVQLFQDAAGRPEGWIIGLAVVSIALVAINMFGGFAVTQRMLEMFRK